MEILKMFRIPKQIFPSMQNLCPPPRILAESGSTSPYFCTLSTWYILIKRNRPKPYLVYRNIALSLLGISQQ